MKKIVVVLVSVLLLAACAKKHGDGGGSSSGGAPDLSQFNDSSGFFGLGEVARIVTDAFNGAVILSGVDKSYTCVKTAAQSSCDGGKNARNRAYADCTMNKGGYRLFGATTVQYASTEACMQEAPQILDPSKTVTRLMTLSLAGRTDGLLKLSSDQQNDYQNRSTGGGQTIDWAGKKYEVKGIHREMVNNAGQSVYRLTISSPAAHSFSGAQLSDFTIAQGGSFNVTHNSLEYKAEVRTITDIRWDASCTCPTSGELIGVLTGNLKGKFRMTYLRCGEAQLVIDKNDELLNPDKDDKWRAEIQDRDRDISLEFDSLRMNEIKLDSCFQK